MVWFTLEFKMKWKCYLVQGQAFTVMLVKRSAAFQNPNYLNPCKASKDGPGMGRRGEAKPHEERK